MPDRSITDADVWAAIRGGDATALVELMRPPGLRERLQHEERDEPRSRSWDEQQAFDVGIRCRGEI